MSKASKGTIRSKIKRGDEVVFVAGKEYNRYERSSDGKVTRVPYQGRVIAVDPRNGKIKVDGAMIVKKHRKAVPQMNIEGGIIKQEAWVDWSNVSLIDPKTGKPTRIKFEVRDGQKVRVAKSGEVIPDPQVFSKRDAKVAAEDKAEENAEETKSQDEEE